MRPRRDCAFLSAASNTDRTALIIDASKDDPSWAFRKCTGRFHYMSLPFHV